MKTTKLLAMSMALCLGATSAFAQPTNDDCGDATTLTPGTILDACTFGNNIDATLQADSIDVADICWASAANHTVWYTFTTDLDGGSYTITTDFAAGDGADTQIQLLSGSCGDFTVVDCDDDGGICTALASEITATLDSTTQYWVQVDLFDDVQGEFGIAVIDNDQSIATPAFDCIATAESITADINAISDTNPFSHKNYDYFNVKKDVIEINQVPYSSCNTPVTAAGANETYFGVWFTFEVDANTKDTWVSVQGVDLEKCDGGESEDIFYTMHLFKHDGSSHPCGTTIALANDEIGCSIGDGLGTNGDSDEDKACGSFFDHPRVNIADLDPGTYSLMVAQMTRVNTVPGTCYRTFFDPLTGEQDSLAYPCDVEEIASPSNGTFELLIEAAPIGNTSIDGVSADNCANAQDITDVPQTGLTNSGLVGNLWTGNTGTCKTEAAANEPFQYDYAASGHGYNNEHCDSTALTIPIGASAYNNNSAVYSFTITDPVIDDEILCYEVSELKELILTTFDILCDTALVIYPGNFPVIFNPDNGEPLVDIGSILESEFGPEIVIPDDATCEDLRIILETILLQLDLLPFDDVCIPLNCSPSVNISLCNLTMSGNEDNGAAVWVTEGDCVNGTEAMYAPIDNGTTALTLNTALEPLAPGTYYIVIDGHGAVLGYDLSVEVSYNLGLGGAPCESNFLPEEKKALANKTQTLFEDINLMPNPASNELTINFKLEKELNSVNVRVIDMTGKEVISTREVSATVGMNAHTIDVSDLSSGLYMISIEKDGQTSLSRFSKN